jgi:hypothetical protein
MRNLQEGCGFRFLGLFEDLRGRADFVDMPILEEGDAIRHFAREASSHA